MTDRASYGLTETQIAALRDAVHGRDAWVFEQHLSYDGDASALAMHEQTGTTIVMFGVAGRIELSEMRDDTLWPLVQFDRIEAATEFVAGMKP